MWVQQIQSNPSSSKSLKTIYLLPLQAKVAIRRLLKCAWSAAHRCRASLCRARVLVLSSISVPPMDRTTHCVRLSLQLSTIRASRSRFHATAAICYWTRNARSKRTKMLRSISSWPFVVPTRRSGWASKWHCLTIMAKRCSAMFLTCKCNVQRRGFTLFFWCCWKK